MQRLRRVAASACRRLASAPEGGASAPQLPPWSRPLHGSASHGALGRNAAAAAEATDPLLLLAQPRDGVGRLAAARQRKAGRLPAVVFNQFNEDKLLITLDAREMLRRLTTFKKSGFLSRVFTVELPGDAGAPPQRIPVLPKQVYADPVTSALEGVTLLRCPPDARIKVDVPLEVIGEDASPGLRKGGTINTMRRKVKCWCLGAAVPPRLTLDLSTLDVGQKITLRDLKLPEGVCHVEADLSLPIIKIMGRVVRGTAEEAAEGGAPAAGGAAAAPAAAAAAAKPAAAKPAAK